MIQWIKRMSEPAKVDLAALAFATIMTASPIIFRNELRYKAQDKGEHIDNVVMEQMMDEFHSYEYKHSDSLKIIMEPGVVYEKGSPLWTNIQYEEGLREGENFVIEYIAEIDDFNPFNPKYITDSRITKDNLSGEWPIYNGTYHIRVQVVDQEGNVLKTSEPIEKTYRRPVATNTNENGRIFDAEDYWNIQNENGKVGLDEEMHNQ